MPPSLSVGQYTLSDFFRRLQRSPTDQISALYHDHRDLFIHRDDVFVRTIGALPWEKGLALLSTAYHTQAISPSVYRAMLVRMVQHNRRVLRTQGDAPVLSSGGRSLPGAIRSRDSTLQLVPWKAALSVYMEAMHTHATRCSTRLASSTLRLLAPHRRWEAALDVVKLEQANDRLTKEMLVDAARVCACREAWKVSLALLDHVHTEDSEYLSSAIRALRPPGTSEQTTEQLRHAVLPPSAAFGDAAAVSASPIHRHLVTVMADVIAAVPWEVTKDLPLAQSFLPHLVASTTLPAARKGHFLCIALKQVPWSDALKLLVENTAPSEDFPPLEGAAAVSSLPPDRVGSKAIAIPDPLLLYLQHAPETLSTLLTAILVKLPTVDAAFKLFAQVRERGRESDGSGITAAALHPMVRDALLVKCTQEPDGWTRAVPLLLNEVPPSRVNAAVLSQIIRQLRVAKEVTTMVEIVQRHIIPSHSTLEPYAITMLLEAILAHNRGLRRRQKKPTTPVFPRTEDGSKNEVQSPQEIVAPDSPYTSSPEVPVKWETALSLLKDNQLSKSEETPCWKAAQVRLGVNICVHAGCCLAAVRLIGDGHRQNRDLLSPTARELTALLYCAHYDRPTEAKAILKRCRERHGDAQTKPLQYMLSLYGPWEQQFSLAGANTTESGFSASS